MRIREIHLRNFKRFNDLLIRDLPEPARLIVVAGPNGCGKSSLFDALLLWYRQHAGFGFGGDHAYYKKDTGQDFRWDQAVTVRLHGDASPTSSSLYLRTAYRNEPDFNISGLSRPRNPTEEARLGRLIDNDSTVSDNYQRLVYATTTGVYDLRNDEKSVRELRAELIGQVQASMQRVFGDLQLNNIADPLGSGAFFFEKGTSKSYHYKNLSGGEKAAFDVLLDLHVKKKSFPNAIYCIDEIEAHLHTRIQSALVQEILQVIPEESQLWVTTHSLGVIRAAQELEAASPGTTCILDFHDTELDCPTVLTPSTLGRVSWEKFLAVALDDLSVRMAPRVIVVCEGSQSGTRRRNFDAEIYNRIFNPHEAQVLFVSGGGSAQVGATAFSAREILRSILPGVKVVGLIDRDARSPDEVADFERDGGIVLGQRSLESYLFADDVLEALLEQAGRSELRSEVIELKNSALADSANRGNASDDMKSASGWMYTGLRRMLDLRSCGNDTASFMRGTLAPLIKPPLETFKVLKAEILGKLGVW